jgi:hypothetical protein
MSSRGRWIVLGSMVGVFVVFNLLLAFFLSIRTDVLAGIVLGTVFAQITLLAACTALGPHSIFYRVAAGLLGAGYVVVTLGGFLFRNTSPNEALAITAAVAAQWFVVQVPLWILRLVTRWRVESPQSAGAAGRLEETQFGIRQLLVWTLLVAILLGLGRIVLIGVGFSPAAAVRSSQFFWIVVLLSAFNSLLAWPLVAAPLAVRRWKRNVVLLPVFVVMITLAEVFSFLWAMGSVDEEIFWWLNLSQSLIVLAVLLAVRGCGYRLMQRGGRSEVAGVS